jgi:hypothetical protein
VANLMTLRRLVRGRIGVPIQDDFFTDPVIDDHINLAIQAIESEYHWPWADGLDAVTLSAGSPGLPYPSDYRATRTIMDGPIELTAVAPGDLMTFLGFTNTSATPAVYCPMDDVIMIAPVPASDRSLTHYWYRQPAWLVDDIDRCLIPDRFTGAIVAKASSLLSSREGANADATRHGQEFTEWIARMRRDVRQTTSPMRVRVRPGGWL